MNMSFKLIPLDLKVVLKCAVSSLPILSLGTNNLSKVFLYHLRLNFLEDASFVPDFIQRTELLYCFPNLIVVLVITDLKALLVLLKFSSFRNVSYL